MHSFKELVFATPKLKRRSLNNSPYQYYYSTNNEIAYIKIKHNEKEYTAIVDHSTLERITKEVTRIYLTVNKIKKVYLSVTKVEDTSRKLPFGRFVLNDLTNLESNVIDHKNGNQLDNRIENLRIVDKKTNMRNRKYNNINKNGHRGVFANGRGGWQVIIHIGTTYKTKEEAAKAYREAYEKLFPGSLIQE